MIKTNVSERNVFIFSDSQAMIKALGKSIIRTTTVKDCVEKLNILGKRNNLTVSWVPGHSGIEGNKKADELANEGTKLDSISIVTPTPDSIK